MTGSRTGAGVGAEPPAGAEAAVGAEVAVSAGGLLRAFNAAGVLHSADVHVAATLGRLAGEPDERVLLATALAVRAVRHGSVCLDLGDAHRIAADDPAVELAWPPTEQWYAACRASPLVAVGAEADPDRPVRLVDRLLYLDRYWRQEQLVRRELDTRAARPPRALPRLTEAVRLLFPADPPDHQRLAAAASAVGSVTVVAGGPGTGKTTTVARMLAVLGQAWDPPPRVALAAPTGKAAARLQEAVAAESARLAATGLPAPGALPAFTLHRLLGSRPGSHTRFKHDRHNRLPFDMVVVDETSMVSLTMMARLLEAVRPDAALVLVGDPDQLASVEAGAVLGDLVARTPPDGADPRGALLTELLPLDVHPAGEVAEELRNGVVRLRTVHRFGGAIAELAELVRRGQADAAAELLAAGAPGVELVADVERPPVGLESLRADVESAGRALFDAAVAGDVPGALAALDRHRLLCGHRRGPHGVTRWSREVERWLQRALPGYAEDGEWYRGRPLIVTANDYDLRLYNGDTGVVCSAPGDRGVVAAFGRGGEPLLLPPSRLSAVETVHAMTVHRSQGSQFDRVTVLLPPPDSPLLTRELLYTALTRARTFVRVVGSPDAVRAAVARPVVRASGLRS